MELERLKELRKCIGESNHYAKWLEMLDTVDELIKEAEPFDPYSLKVDDEVWVWGEDEDRTMRRFAVYMPATNHPFKCFHNGDKQKSALGTTGWEHCEPVGEKE